MFPRPSSPISSFQILILSAFQLFSFSAFSPPAFAWGQNGHRITAQIAYQHLTPTAKKAVAALIDDENFVELSTWPDHIRSDPEWDHAEPWHFMSVDDDAAISSLTPPLEGNILSKLEDFERTLRNSSPSKKDKRDALAFYIHLVGDIHQPLHVGRKEDAGGNRFQVMWFDEETNLHKLWDENLIESAGLSYTEFATLLDNVPAKNIDSWQKSSYLTWANESQALRPQVYNFDEQRPGYFVNIVSAPNLSWKYRHDTLPLVRQRLQQAGIRLAGKLNDIFSP
jgi:hypothetical protein